MIPGKQELNQMASPQLTLAAQTNGRKSRGPVTPEGKRKSSANSHKHGLRSKTLPTDEACEAHRQWLLPHLIAQHNPASPIELMLVETIAQASARQDWAIRISDGYHAEAIQHQSSPEAPYKHPGRHAIELLHRAFSRFARKNAAPSSNSARSNPSPNSPNHKNARTSRSSPARSVGLTLAVCPASSRI